MRGRIDLTEKCEMQETRPDRMPCMPYDLSVRVRPWEFGSSPT